MTSRELSREYTAVYGELRLYALKAIRAFRLRHEPEWIVADAYLHLWAMREDIGDTGRLVAISKNFIKMNLQWWNSPYRRQTRGSEAASSSPLWEAAPEWELPSPEALAALEEEWCATLKTRESRLFHLYTRLEIRRGRELSVHLGISTSSAYGLLHEAAAIEERYRLFLIQKCT